MAQAQRRRGRTTLSAVCLALVAAGAAGCSGPDIRSGAPPLKLCGITFWSGAEGIGTVSLSRPARGMPAAPAASRLPARTARYDGGPPPRVVSVSADCSHAYGRRLPRLLRTGAHGRQGRRRPRCRALPRSGEARHVGRGPRLRLRRHAPDRSGRHRRALTAWVCPVLPHVQAQERVALRLAEGLHGVHRYRAHGRQVAAEVGLLKGQSADVAPQETRSPRTARFPGSGDAVATRGDLVPPWVMAPGGIAQPSTARAQTSMAQDNDDPKEDQGSHVLLLRMRTTSLPCEVLGRGMGRRRVSHGGTGTLSGCRLRRGEPCCHLAGARCGPRARHVSSVRRVYLPLGPNGPRSAGIYLGRFSRCRRAAGRSTPEWCRPAAFPPDRVRFGVLFGTFRQVAWGFRAESAPVPEMCGTVGIW
jgi:hypothetical protein